MLVIFGRFTPPPPTVRFGAKNEAAGVLFKEFITMAHISVEDWAYALLRYLEPSVAQDRALAACASIAPFLVKEPTIILDVFIEASMHPAGVSLLTELARHWAPALVNILRLNVRRHLFVLGLVLAFPEKYKHLVATMNQTTFSKMIDYVHSRVERSESNALEWMSVLLQYRKIK